MSNMAGPRANDVLGGSFSLLTSQPCLLTSQPCWAHFLPPIRPFPSSTFLPPFSVHPGLCLFWGPQSHIPYSPPGMPAEFNPRCQAASRYEGSGKRAWRRQPKTWNSVVVVSSGSRSRHWA